MHHITCGADPEFFLAKGGVIVPCVGLVPGTKEHPFKLLKSKTGLTVQEDNVTLELGWKPVPIADWDVQVAKALREAHTFVTTHLGKEWNLAYSTSSHTFTDAELASDQAQMFGCDPDRDAYQKGNFRLPVDPKLLENDRFAGGHLHVGYDMANSLIPPYALVQLMDLAYLFIIQDGVDVQGGRRKYYGLPGLFREKEYGVEYRTPGNFWATHSHYAGSILRLAEQALNKPRAAQKIYKAVKWDAVRESIMTEKATVDMYHLSDLFNDLYEAPVEPTNLKQAA